MPAATNHPPAFAGLPFPPAPPVSGYEIHAAGPRLGNLVHHGDLYSAALAFVRGEVSVEGDLVDAVRDLIAARRHGLRHAWHTTLGRLATLVPESWFQTRARAARDIRFHYDLSNDFYRQFLDSRLVYSCAYFKDPAWSLERAQVAKLDHICRKLDLRPGERFLDIGCGWGALVIHAVAYYDVIATGCTLSQAQSELASRLLADRRITDVAAVCCTDYRELCGRFKKIASVGMFEHVGRHRLPAYFRQTADLLEEDGLFLNHGITRPETVRISPESLFLRRRVFPGGELPHLSEVVEAAECAGLEVLDVENLRPHYALTCRAWVKRLQDHMDACLRVVEPEAWRTWVLYLAASAANFETGQTDVYQLLMAKRSHPKPRRMSRDYMYPRKLG